jgi:hypothetical protein
LLGSCLGFVAADLGGAALIPPCEGLPARRPRRAGLNSEGSFLI